MDPRLVADTTQAEGRKLTAYRDSRGFWTAGVGHKLDQNTDWTNVTFSSAQVDAWLNQDLAWAQQQAMQIPGWHQLDTACRQNAVDELVFNMGLAKFLNFRKTIAAIQAQDWQTAHDELLNSDWCNEVQPHINEPGRATRIAGYLLTGQYP